VTGPAHTSTRDIARAAVRAELAQAALDLFRRKGFDQVTVNDVAAAAGVSRSTFLRYFGSKEEAVLGAFDTHGQKIADALRARPAEEDDWTALRRALDTFVEEYHQNPASTLALARLVRESPALCARHREKKHCWRPEIAAALAERTETAPEGEGLRPAVLTAAALDCVDIAVDRWIDSDGKLDLAALIEEVFTVLTPR
jgi:AcrR family transcriptional regulator